MAFDQFAFLELPGELKLADVTDRVRVASETLYQELIDAEAAAFVGAGQFESSPGRVTQRNGTRGKMVTTTVGDLESRIVSRAPFVKHVAGLFGMLWRHRLTSARGSSPEKLARQSARPFGTTSRVYALSTADRVRQPPRRPGLLSRAMARSFGGTRGPRWRSTAVVVGCALVRDLVDAHAASLVLERDESAGGNLSLVFAFRANERGARRPDHLVIHAPWVERRTQHPQSLTLKPEDVLMEVDQLQRAGSAWAGSRELTDPLISPIFGDLDALPPLTVLQGTEDLLLPDVLAFADQARAAGTEVELELFDGAFHVYIGIDTPQSGDSLDLAADRVRGTLSPPS